MTTFFFNNDLKIIKSVQDERLIQSDQTDELAGLITHTITIPYSSDLEKVSYFGMPDPSPELAEEGEGGLPFWLYKVDNFSKGKDGELATFDGTFKLFDDLRGGYIEDKRPESTTFMKAAESIFEDTGWDPIVQGPAREKIASANFYMVSKLSAFWSALEAWGLEFRPYMEFSGSFPTRQVVYFKENFGKDSGKSYAYGDKLLEVVADKSHDFYTAFIGRGGGEPTGRQNTGGKDTYGRKITFKDVLWDQDSGTVDYTYKKKKEKDMTPTEKPEDPVAIETEEYEDVHVRRSGQDLPYDKPKGQIFVEDYEATLLYGYPPDKWHKYYRPKVGFFDLSDCTDPGELLEKTAEHLKAHHEPEIQCKAKVFEWEGVRLGDTVRVKAPDLDLFLRKRIYKQVRSFLNPRVKEIEFGEEIVESSSRSSIRGVVAERKAEEARTDAMKHYVHNFNGTINWYTETEPANPVKGDLWFFDEGNGSQHIYYFDGEKWQELISSDTKKKIEESVAEAGRNAEERFQEIMDDLPDLVDGAFGKLTPEEITSFIKNGDVLSIINQQAGSIIFGAEDSEGRNLLQITPDTTYIKNGTITNAMIDSLNAGKIKGGTIDAEEVRVINIDAGEITTGKLDGDRIRANEIDVEDLGGNRFHFVQGAITDGTDALRLFPDSVYLGSASGYGFYTKLSSNGMDFIYDGHYTGTLTTSTTSGGEVSGIMLYARPGNTLYIGAKYGSTYYRSLIVDRYNTTLRGRIRIEDENNRLAFDLRTTDYTYPWRVYVDSDYQRHRLVNANVSGTSDPRLKKNIQKWDKSGVKELLKINFRTFEWKDPEMGEGKQYGVIAKEGDFISDRDKDGTLYISFNDLIYLTGKATQELAEENDKMKERVEALEEKVARLEELLEGLI